MHCIFNFLPVGQGGFSTGSIKEDGHPRFDFVYDCGTLTAGPYLAHQISEVKNRFRIEEGKITIDMLIISHFDEDHVNGVVELLKEVRCRILVIPFMTVLERLTAFAKGGAKAQWHQRMLENPQIFFSGEEFDIERVIAVDSNDEPLSGNSDIVVPFEQKVMVSNSPTELTRLSEGGLTFGNEFFYMRVPFTLKEEKIGFYFKFYIKRLPAASVTAFMEAVTASIPHLTAAELFKDKFRLILKGIYNRIFTNINKTSLCVSIRKKHRTWVRYDFDSTLRFDFEPRLVGLLLTGDCFLKSSVDITEFLGYYREEIEDTILFQIPHHGSAYNSSLDKANALWDFRLFVMQYGEGRVKHPSVTLNKFLIENNFNVSRITEVQGYKLGFEIR